ANVEVLKKILMLCQERNIEVILVTTPTYWTYSSNLEKTQLDKTLNTAKSVCSEFERCEYYNFLTDTAFIAEDFKDADHLNSIGATKFSHILNQIVNGN